ncbi:type III secretion system co-regulatory protein PtrC [Pseudomonas indica]|uniref:Uncharacterized protein n=1 Tax=Pseudomonas indica TaxID=137658 RepID=A0A1G9L043_9PSED|nr:type III secretion system co-regulatory protein PtrC [Pseudomonas indica]SDL55133.1 hypothetical protein SAMN05216186_12374 [Pseudomonas indica]
MSTAENLPLRNGYGVTYATLDETGLHFESELAIHLRDGNLLTLKMPTRQSEQRAIREALRGRINQRAA